jgi:uncharacterized repeat protein (TIGR02543 family)
MATKLIQGQLFNALIKGLVTPGASWYDKDTTIKYITCNFESTSAVDWAKVSTQDSDYEVYASYDGSETVSINIIADASDFSSDNPLRLYLDADSSGMFYYFGALEDIIFFASTPETSSIPVVLLWDKVTNIVTTNPNDDMMAGMFEKCASLKNFGMASTEYWDSDTTVLGFSSLAKMFFDCQSLKSCSICLNKEQDNTALVTNVMNMFYHCEELESVVLVGNFSGVTRGANNMFYGCESLYKFTVPSGMANLSLPYYTDWSTEEGTDVVYARFGFLKNSDSDFSNVYSDLASKTVPNDLPSDYKWARKATLLDIYLDFEASTPYDTDIIFEKQTGISEPAEPTKEGYTFEGWYASDKVTPFDFTQTFTGLTLNDIGVYANWTVGALTVTFDSNGGSQISPYTNVEYGSKIAEPSTPEKLENDFDGWYKDSEFETAWDFENDTVTENITLYAKWIEWSKSRIFNPNAYRGESLRLTRGNKVRREFRPFR